MHAGNGSGGATRVAGIAALALAAGCAGAAKLSAAEIVAKNVEARGGLEEWRKIQTMVWTGRIESARVSGPGLQFTLEQKRPNKTRMEVTSLGERSIRVYDGAEGWRLRAAHGRPEAQPFTPQELRFAQGGHGIDGPLIDSAVNGSPVTLEGVDEIVDEIGKRKAYHLSLHQAKGGGEDVWVDTGSYLEIRYDRMTEGPSGSQRRVSTTYADYHTVEGVKLPFVIETGSGQGTARDKLLVERVALNAPLDDSTFENPAAPRLRHRALPGLAPRGPVRAPAAAHAANEGGSASQ